jgi:tetratricopeptide (TPR) repeat protein
MQRVIILVSLSFLLLFRVGAAAVPSHKPENSSDVASITDVIVLAHLRRGEYRKAQAVVEQALAIEPCNPDLNQALGALCYALGDVERAIVAFTQAIRQSPGRATAYHYRGCSFASKKDWLHAIEDYNKAIKIDPDRAASYSSRGIAYRSQSLYLKAKDDFQTAVKHGEENPNIFLLAQLLATCPDASVRDGQRALDYANMICQRTKYKDPEFLNLLAAAYAEARQWDKASFWVEQALGLCEKREDDRDPSGGQQMHIEMCRELYRLHQPDRTMPPQYLGGKPPQSAVEALLYGVAKTVYRDHKGAIRDFERSIGLDPSLLSSHYYLATELTQLGSGRDSIHHYNIVLKSNPKNFPALAWRAEAYCEIGRYCRALADARASLSLSPHHFRARLIQAWAQIGLGQNNLASVGLDQLEEECPDDPRVHFVRGKSFLSQGQLHAAVDEFGKAIWELDPSPLAYAERAVALAALGRAKEARMDLEKCIQLNPDLRERTESRMKEKRRECHGGMEEK